MAREAEEPEARIAALEASHRGRDCRTGRTRPVRGEAGSGPFRPKPDLGAKSGEGPEPAQRRRSKLHPIAD
jgi:hypothetical protein